MASLREQARQLAAREGLSFNAARNRLRRGTADKDRTPDPIPDKRAWIDGLKSVPCADCKNLFPPICMDFDHVRGVKLFTISSGLDRPSPELLWEMAKCDIVCSNCHRIRTKLRRRT